MLADKIQYVVRRVESLLAIANFGASSVYWLTTAFLISVDDYGRLMTLQAAILLLVALFTLRTHDLVYYLTVSHGNTLAQAWRAALAMEVTAALLCLGTGLSAIYLVLPGRFTDPSASALFLVFATVVVGQQASIARLRRQGQASVIRIADACTLALWGLAVLYLLLGFSRERDNLLIVGAVPQAARTLIIVGGAFLLRERDRNAGPPVRWRAVVRYVIGGQAVNFIKNGATSIETTILAAFITPAPVALYRLAKSAQGIVTPFVNVAFQQGTDALSSARDAEHREDLLRRLRLRGLRGSLAVYPAAAIFAAVYAYVKPDVGMFEFQVIMAVSFLTLMPQILFQGPFIILSLAGRQGTINLIFLVSTVVLVVASCALFAVPSIWVFLAALMATNVTRQFLIEGAARRVAPTPGVRAGEAPPLDQPEDLVEPAFGAQRT